MAKGKGKAPRNLQPKREKSISSKPARMLATAGNLAGSRSARILDAIRRDMEGKNKVFRKRRRNEEILALAYQDGTMLGGGDEAENLCENAFNLPYRYVRWLESQATAKDMVVKVSRDAGEGQLPGGPSDAETGAWLGEALKRIAYEGGLKRELRAAVGEVAGRGTSVLKIGYHEQEITYDQGQEVGKDAQSVIPEVLMERDVEAKDGQAHEEISAGLASMAQDPLVQSTLGTDGIAAMLARKDSHDVASRDEKVDTDSPKESTRLLRRRLWVQKRRVGEDVGWAHHVYDTEDTPFWWERVCPSVAECKKGSFAPLLSASFRSKVEGYDGRNVSGVAQGGQTLSTESMDSDARQAQSEDVLDDDERIVELYFVWFRRPDLLTGGVRKIVCAECPEEFVEADERNPNVYRDETGVEKCAIPGFYPFYDFTPIQPTLTVPARTLGIPLVAPGMPQFEKISEYNRLRTEAARRHSLRLYEIHPALKDNKRVQDALKNGEDGFAYVAAPGQVDSTGKLHPGVTPIQFTGNTAEIDREAAREEGDWVKVMGMPPAVLQGVGTAETATQETQGIAAGEREAGALLALIEDRLADVVAGLRGLARAFYDDEDWVALVGAQGAQVLQAWQKQTTDDGDKLSVTFGMRAEAQKTVDRKQMMEAVTLEQSQVEPITGLPKYNSDHLIEEIHRSLGAGPPKVDNTPLRQLQKLCMALAAQIQQLTGVNPLAPAGGGGGPPGSNGPNGPGNGPEGGPNKAEGNGPTQGNLNAGATRDTFSASAA